MHLVLEKLNNSLKLTDGLQLLMPLFNKPKFLFDKWGVEECL